MRYRRAVDTGTCALNVVPRSFRGGVLVPESRVKVAGVMMSREEAAEVEAERERLFGPRYRSLMPSNDPDSPPVVVFIVPIVLLAIGACVATSVFQFALFEMGVPDALIRVVIVLGFLLISAGPVMWFARSRHRRECREAMRRIGWCICAECGYVIGRGAPVVCPECGKAFNADG